MADKQYKCEICKIDAGSESNYKSHIGGIKHKKKCISLGHTSNPVQPIVKNVYEPKRNLSVEENVEKIKINKNIDHNLNRVRDIVSSTVPFPQLMINLMKEIQLPIDVMTDKYNHVCHDLERVLRVRLPQCRANPFGSTITGLSFKTSDLDIYIDINRLLLPPDLREKDASDFTRISRNLMFKSHLFTKIVAIPHAKTPIVKCLHVPTGVNCDFNFKSMLGVCNSRLIKFFLANNKSFLGAMIIIKYWAKLHDLSGTGKFTNYTLSMMFIFYLQINHYLPSVYSLQLSNEHAFIQEGWNGGFCADVNLLPKINTPLEVLIPQLLLGFFKFYSTFDFGLYVISPLVGKQIAKSLFVDVKNLPTELLFYKQVVSNPKEKPLKILTPICVQDPFVLAHNITNYISSKLLQEFQNLCENSFKIVDSEKDTPNKILYKILFAVPKPKINNLDICDLEMCAFKIPYTLSVLPTSSKTDANELSKIWFDKLHQFLSTVLTKVFLFDIKVLSTGKECAPKKHLKMEGKTDVHDNNIIDNAKFHCTANLNIWEGRKNFTKTFHETNKTEYLTSLDREIAISEYIVNVIYKKDNPKSPFVEFEINCTMKINPTEAKFVLKNIKSNKSSFKILGQNLALVIPKWFQIYLKEIDFAKIPDKEIISGSKEIKEKEANNTEFQVKMESETEEKPKTNKFLECIEKIQNQI